MRRKIVAIIGVLALMLAVVLSGIRIGPAQAHNVWNNCSVTGRYEIWYSATRWSDNWHDYMGSGPNGSYTIRHRQFHYPSHWSAPDHYITCGT